MYVPLGLGPRLCQGKKSWSRYKAFDFFLLLVTAAAADNIYGAQRQLSTRRFLSFWMVAKPLNNHKLVSSSLSNKLTESSITASNEIQPRQESILMTLTIHQSHFQDMRNTWASFSICLNRQKKNQSTVELNPHLFSPLLTQPVTRLAATLGAFLSIIDGLKSNKTPSI